MVQQAIEKGIFKGLPLISANQKYLDIVQSLEGANNIKNAFDIQDVLDSKQRGDNKYAYYTEELKDKVDAYEKAHGTYQPSFVQSIVSNVLSPKGPKVIKTPAFKTGGFKEKKCYTCVGRKRRV
jgi:hypothetical protein